MWKLENDEESGGETQRPYRRIIISKYLLLTIGIAKKERVCGKYNFYLFICPYIIYYIAVLYVYNMPRKLFFRKSIPKNTFFFPIHHTRSTAFGWKFTWRLNISQEENSTKSFVRWAKIVHKVEKYDTFLIIQGTK